MECAVSSPALLLGFGGQGRELEGRVGGEEILKKRRSRPN